MSDDAAHRLLAKVRGFVRHDLDSEERALFAALLAPGVARAYSESGVAGFSVTDWSSGALPDSLTSALREQKIRVVGLD